MSKVDTKTERVIQSKQETSQGLQYYLDRTFTHTF